MHYIAVQNTSFATAIVQHASEPDVTANIGLQKQSEAFILAFRSTAFPYPKLRPRMPASPCFRARSLPKLLIIGLQKQSEAFHNSLSKLLVIISLQSSDRASQLVQDVPKPTVIAVRAVLVPKRHLLLGHGG